ncbi:MAG: permease-like cell division protein FtsX [Myxococcota bacterium]
MTTSIAVLTIAAALVLAGGFGLLVTNMGDLLARFGAELHVVAYLEAGLGDDELRALAASVSTVEGVEDVKIVSKAEALDRFRESVGGAALLEGLADNPLPASLEVALQPRDRTPEGVAIVVGALSGLPGISELAHGQEWVEGYARFASLVRAGSLGLGLILAVAALMIVANTIRLAVYSREDESEILLLVGASRSFVRIPFLLEGALQGAIGGALAVGLLYLGFVVFLPSLEYGLEFVLGNTAPHFFSSGQAMALIGAGGGLGLLGSLTAVLGGRPAS